MERLTFEGLFCDIAMCRENPCPYDGACSQRKTWERLKEYEDTGLEPEDVKALIAIHGLPAQEIVRICKLYQAEQDGRLVVLPCKVGDTIWRIKSSFAEWPDISKPYVEADAFLYRDIHYFGKTVFLTREEAEAALKGGDEG